MKRELGHISIQHSMCLFLPVMLIGICLQAHMEMASLFEQNTNVFCYIKYHQVSRAVLNSQFIYVCKEQVWEEKQRKFYFPYLSVFEKLKVFVFVFLSFFFSSFSIYISNSTIREMSGVCESR